MTRVVCLHCIKASQERLQLLLVVECHVSHLHLPINISKAMCCPLVPPHMNSESSESECDRKTGTRGWFKVLFVRAWQFLQVQTMSSPKLCCTQRHTEASGIRSDIVFTKTWANVASFQSQMAEPRRAGKRSPKHSIDAPLSSLSQRRIAQILLNAGHHQVNFCMVELERGRPQGVT